MLVGIFGNLGSGKTLQLTKSLWQRHNEGYTTWSNYHTTFSDRVECAEILLLELEDMFLEHNKIVFGIDELGIILQSRHFMSSQNEILTVIFRKSRKKGIDVYYTSQSSMMVDANIRRITDIAVSVCYNPISHRVTSSIFDSKISGFEFALNTTYDATQFFKMYDTNEVIETNTQKILEKMYDRCVDDEELMAELQEATRHNIRVQLIKFKTQISLNWCNVILAKMKHRKLLD